MFQRPSLLSAKQKIIVLAVIFNLALELWVHGIAGFSNPALVISLFLMYLSYFSALVDLRIRFNLRDWHVIIFGFTFGMIQETFNTGSVFNDPNFFGVNLINIILINLFWWGILQSVFALYFANRLVKLPEEDVKKMGPIGWSISAGIILFFLLIAFFENGLSGGTFTAYIIIGLAIVASVAVFILSKKPKTKRSADRNSFVDFLIIVQFVLCVFFGLSRSYIGYSISVHFFIAWSLLVTIFYAITRFKGKFLVG